MHRALTTSSSRTPSRAVNPRPTQRYSRGTATLSYPHDDETPTFDLQIFDIFDAPSRLGESNLSKMLRREKSTSASQASTSAKSTLHTLAQPERVPRRTVKPLPAPVTYDGPARPKHMSMMAHRSSPSSGHRHRAHSAERVSYESQSYPSSLPPPITFDGPSRPRPYNRYSGSNDSGMPSVGVQNIILGAFH